MAEYFTHISVGAGEKMGQLLQTISSTATGVAIGIYFHPWFGLAICAYLPVASFLMVKFKISIIKSVIGKMGQNAKLGGFTEELLTSMKLIKAFGKEKEKLEEYKKLAEETYRISARSGKQMGTL